METSSVYAAVQELVLARFEFGLNQTGVRFLLPPYAISRAQITLQEVIVRLLVRTFGISKVLPRASIRVYIPDLGQGEHTL